MLRPTLLCLLLLAGAAQLPSTLGLLGGLVDDTSDVLSSSLDADAKVELDVVLIVDHSGSLADYTGHIKQAYGQIVDSIFALPGIDARVAIVTHAAVETLVFTDSQNILSDTIDNLEIPFTGDADISGSLAQCEQLFLEGARANARRVAVTITDGAALNVKEIAQAAQDLRVSVNPNVDLFCLYIPHPVAYWRANGEQNARAIGAAPGRFLEITNPTSYLSYLQQLKSCVTTVVQLDYVLPVLDSATDLVGGLTSSLGFNIEDCATTGIDDLLSTVGDSSTRCPTSAELEVLDNLDAVDLLTETEIELDVVVLLDHSGSLNSYAGHIKQAYLQLINKIFALTGVSARVAVVTHAPVETRVFTDDLSALTDLINNVEIPFSSVTDISGGLSQCEQLFLEGARANSRRVVYTITDGVALNVDDIAQTAQDLRVSVNPNVDTFCLYVPHPVAYWRANGERNAREIGKAAGRFVKIAYPDSALAYLQPVDKIVQDVVQLDYVLPIVDSATDLLDGVFGLSSLGFNIEDCATTGIDDLLSTEGDSSSRCFTGAELEVIDNLDAIDLLAEGDLALDVVVLLDHSGSLDGYASYIKEAYLQLIDNLFALSDVAPRVAVVTHAPVETHIFTDDLSALKEIINSIDVPFRGDADISGSLSQCEQLFLEGARADSRRIAFTITDGAALQVDAIAKAAQNLRVNPVPNVDTYCLYVPHPVAYWRSNGEQNARAIGKATGRFLEITNPNIALSYLQPVEGMVEDIVKLDYVLPALPVVDLTTELQIEASAGVSFNIGDCPEGGEDESESSWGDSSNRCPTSSELDLLDSL